MIASFCMYLKLLNVKFTAIDFKKKGIPKCTPEETWYICHGIMYVKNIWIL